MAIVPRLEGFSKISQTIFGAVLSEKSSGGRECFFFCPHGDGRRPRLTERGYWKGRNYELDIAKKGTKRYFTYYQGRQGQHRRTDVTMHEYHMIPAVSDPEISDPVLFSSWGFSGFVSSWLASSSLRAMILSAFYLQL